MDMIKIFIENIAEIGYTGIIASVIAYLLYNHNQLVNTRFGGILMFAFMLVSVEFYNNNILPY